MFYRNDEYHPNNSERNMLPATARDLGALIVIGIAKDFYNQMALLK